MESMSYTAVRSNLAKTLDRICRDHSPVLLTRHKAPSVVMLSLADYRSMEETAYLLRSPANAARLAEAIAEIEAGRASRPWPAGRRKRSRARAL
jgi:antitoxin YefM